MRTRPTARRAGARSRPTFMTWWRGGREQRTRRTVQTDRKLGKGGSLEYVPEVHGFQHPCLLEPADAAVAAA